MATTFSSFDTTPATAIAAIKAAILASSDWSNPAGDRVVATTTRGASMVVDLADAAATATRLQFGVYRTTGLADKIIRYLMPRSSGATTDPHHCIVSAGKEHLFISVEGPRAGETSPEDSSRGSYRPTFFLCDLVPYFAADTVPAVVCGGPNNSSQPPTPLYSFTISVSRNAANTASWVPGVLETLQPGRGATSASVTPQRYAGQSLSGAGQIVRPYVVFEDATGMRGRLSSFFNMGFNSLSGTTAGDVPAQTFQRVIIGSATYIGLATNKRVQTSYSTTAFAEMGSGDGDTGSPVVAVPYA